MKHHGLWQNSATTQQAKCILLKFLKAFRFPDNPLTIFSLGEEWSWRLLKRSKESLGNKECQPHRKKYHFENREAVVSKHPTVTEAEVPPPAPFPHLAPRTLAANPLLWKIFLWRVNHCKRKSLKTVTSGCPCIRQEKWLSIVESIFKCEVKSPPPWLMNPECQLAFPLIYIRQSRILRHLRKTHHKRQQLKQTTWRK